MEKYEKFIEDKMLRNVREAQAKVALIHDQLLAAESQLEKARKDRESTKVRDFVRNTQKATEMPERGEPFVYLDGDTDCTTDGPFADKWSRWVYLGARAIVANPHFGFAVRFTANHDGMLRLLDGCAAKHEFLAGDLLEFLGVGARKDLKPGDNFCLMTTDMGNNCVIRHAMETYDGKYDDEGRRHGDHVFDARLIDVGWGRVSEIKNTGDFMISNVWPPITGTVVSVEPRCSAYDLPEGAQTLEEVQDTCQEVYFTLREIYLSLGPSMKAAAKKK